MNACLLLSALNVSKAMVRCLYSVLLFDWRANWTVQWPKMRLWEALVESKRFRPSEHTV